MTCAGYFLLICTCDKCRAESLYRAMEQAQAWAKARTAGWGLMPSSSDGVLCPVCFAKEARKPSLPLFDQAKRHMHIVGNDQRLVADGHVEDTSWRTVEGEE